MLIADMTAARRSRRRSSSTCATRASGSRRRSRTASARCSATSCGGGRTLRGRSRAPSSCFARAVRRGADYEEQPMIPREQLVEQSHRLRARRDLRRVRLLGRQGGARRELRLQEDPRGPVEERHRARVQLRRRRHAGRDRVGADDARRTRSSSSPSGSRTRGRATSRTRSSTCSSATAGSRCATTATRRSRSSTGSSDTPRSARQPIATRAVAGVRLDDERPDRGHLRRLAGLVANYQRDLRGSERGAGSTGVPRGLALARTARRRGAQRARAAAARRSRRSPSLRRTYLRFNDQLDALARDGQRRRRRR
jgi:hypothetical protein